MRKITECTALALKEKRALTMSNTEVTSNGIIARLWLHGNQIASFDGSTLFISDAGWRTTTTKERLNGILEVFGFKGGISQKDFEWYFISKDKDYNVTAKESWSGSKMLDV